LPALSDDGAREGRGDQQLQQVRPG
jgi:hypothetical protein